MRAMRIHAYLLAADPTWLRASVGAYYSHVERLVVSYDAGARGWTGAPVRVDECLGILRSLDVDGKIEWIAGDFAAGATQDYVAADTRQRRHALTRAGAGADWVLQIDTDEILPDWVRLHDMLERAAGLGLPAVEWPMRVLFRRLPRGRYLEIATTHGTTHFEYPGPIAVRPEVTLVECRRTGLPYLRPLVRGDRFSLQVRRSPETGEHRADLLAPHEAILHNSWARRPEVVREKLSSWSHNQGAKSWLYYYAIWLPAPVTWRLLRRLHPLHGPLWPRVWQSADLPEGLDD
jgi:hypothetical protein